MKNVGFIGWRGMVGSVLMQRMVEERDFDAIRMETRLPCRPTRASLTSPSYLARNRTLGPPIKNNPEISPVIER